MKGELGTAIGVAAVAFLDNYVAKQFTTVSQTMRGAVLLAAGVGLPMLSFGKKIPTPILAGATAVGVIELMKSFNVISGVPRVPLRMGAYNPNAGVVGAYNPNAPAIGASGQPFLTQTVGTMPNMEAEMMGALLYED